MRAKETAEDSKSERDYDSCSPHELFVLVTEGLSPCFQTAGQHKVGEMSNRVTLHQHA